MTSRPLLLWGAGRNGKDMAKLLRKREDAFIWVSDNPRKTGETIYGIKLEDTYRYITKRQSPDHGGCHFAKSQNRNPQTTLGLG
jgi:FlaA1/EpsC-like NDP-sugar epimerase